VTRCPPDGEWQPRLGLALRGSAEATAIEPLLSGYLTALPRVRAEAGVMTLVLCVPPNRPGVARVDIALIDSSATDQTRELTQVLAEDRGDWSGRECGLSRWVAEVVALITRFEQRGPTVAPVRSCARPTTLSDRTSRRPGCLPSGVVQRDGPQWGAGRHPRPVGRCRVGRRTRRVVIPESPRRPHGQPRPCGPCQSGHPERTQGAATPSISSPPQLPAVRRCRTKLDEAGSAEHGLAMVRCPCLAGLLAW
jgi:hypothetical protein